MNLLCKLGIHSGHRNSFPATKDNPFFGMSSSYCRRCKKYVKNGWFVYRQMWRVRLFLCRKRKNIYNDDSTEILRDRLVFMKGGKFKRAVFEVYKWFRAIDMSECQCPCCGWEMPDYCGDDSVPVVYSPVSHGPEGTTDWTETWTCAECALVFDLENGT